MRKIAVRTMFCVVGLVGSAQAVKPPHPQHPSKVASEVVRGAR